LNRLTNIETFDIMEILLELASCDALNLIFLSLPHQKKFTRVSPDIYTVTSPSAKARFAH